MLREFDDNFYTKQLRIQEENKEYIEEIAHQYKIKLRDPKKVSLPFKESINLKSQDEKYIYQYKKNRTKDLQVREDPWVEPFHLQLIRKMKRE